MLYHVASLQCHVYAITLDDKAKCLQKVCAPDVFTNESGQLDCNSTNIKPKADIVFMIDESESAAVTSVPIDDTMNVYLDEKSQLQFVANLALHLADPVILF